MRYVENGHVVSRYDCPNTEHSAANSSVTCGWRRSNEGTTYTVLTVENMALVANYGSSSDEDEAPAPSPAPVVTKSSAGGDSSTAYVYSSGSRCAVTELGWLLLIDAAC